MTARARTVFGTCIDGPHRKIHSHVGSISKHGRGETITIFYKLAKLTTYSFTLADEDIEEEEVLDEEAQLMASMGLPLAFASSSDHRRAVSWTFWEGELKHLIFDLI